MSVLITVLVSLVLAAATVLVAASHNRPFDGAHRRFARRPGKWWWGVPE